MKRARRQGLRDALAIIDEHIQVWEKHCDAADRDWMQGAIYGNMVGALEQVRDRIAARETRDG